MHIQKGYIIERTLVKQPLVLAVMHTSPDRPNLCLCMTCTVKHGGKGVAKKTFGMAADTETVPCHMLMATIFHGSSFTVP